MKNRIGTYFRLMHKNSARLMENFLSQDNWRAALLSHNDVYKQSFNRYMAEKKAEQKKKYAEELVIFAARGMGIAREIYGYEPMLTTTEDINHADYKEMFEAYCKEKNPELKRRIATQLDNIMELVILTGGKQ